MKLTDDNAVSSDTNTVEKYEELIAELIRRRQWVSVAKHGFPRAEQYTEFEVFCYNTTSKYTYRAIVPLEDGILFAPKFGEVLYWRHLDDDPTEETVEKDVMGVLDIPEFLRKPQKEITFQEISNEPTKDNNQDKTR